MRTLKTAIGTVVLVFSLSSVANANVPLKKEQGVALAAAYAMFGFVGRNVESSSREKDFGSKALKVITGISAKDIKKHGITGGRCSFINNPFGKGC